MAVIKHFGEKRESTQNGPGTLARVHKNSGVWGRAGESNAVAWAIQTFFAFLPYVFYILHIGGKALNYICVKADQSSVQRTSSFSASCHVKA
jgi:hypothetical protein